MKLYEIDKGSKIYGLEPVIGGTLHKNAVIVFHHIDGAYSYCTIEEADGTPLEDENGQPAVVHLNASMPLVTYEDGYRVDLNALGETK